MFEDVNQNFEILNTSNSPGFSILIMKDDFIVLEKSYGLSNLVSKEKITSETNFNMASVSKQFTALGILLLAQEKRLSLDENISRYLPELKSAFSNVTISHLIYHSSGIPNYFELIDGSQAVFNKLILEAIASKNKLNFNPGTHFDYSNSGYVLLSEIIERVSNLPFTEFIEERFLIKLGMNNSFVFGEKNIDRDPGRAIGYGEWPTFEERDKSNWNYNFGDGGLCSNVNDMKKWIQFLNQPEILFNSPFKEMIFKSGTDIEGNDLNYSFGFFTGEVIENQKSLLHSGSWLGFRSLILNLPSSNTWLLYLSNCAGMNAFVTSKLFLNKAICI